MSATASRREFLTQTAPAAALAVTVAATVLPGTVEPPASDPHRHSPSKPNHPQEIRLAMACLAFEDAILDYLAVEPELDDTQAMVLDADHLLYAVDHFRNFLDGEILHDDGVPIHARELVFWEKLLRRKERFDAEGGRDYLQAEEWFYDRAKREAKETADLLGMRRVCNGKATAEDKRRLKERLAELQAEGQ